jgi:hypothetical protein
MKLFDYLEFIAQICIVLGFMYVLWLWAIAIKFAEQQYFGY